jgi:hypothetical protein
LETNVSKYITGIKERSQNMSINVDIETKSTVILSVALNEDGTYLSCQQGAD